MGKKRKGITKEPIIADRCQTPPYALDPILPHINKTWTIWEPARGEGNIARTLDYHGYTVIGTDILTGEDFFDTTVEHWDCIVTNPPYSIKYLWLERCYQLGKALRV